MAQEGLHKHAFWLYGVIVGLAIKHAVETVLPSLLASPFTRAWESLPEAVRLFLFLVIIIRFYLGYATYFDDVYYAADADTKYPTKNYLVDFLFGFAHFLIFLVWAMSLQIPNRPLLFLGLLGAILLYDVVWFLACRDYAGARRMKLWMLINVATFILSSVIYLATTAVGGKETLAEVLAYIPVLLVSGIDIAELTSQRRIIADWLQGFIR